LGGRGTTHFFSVWLDLRGYLPIPRLPADVLSGINVAYVTDYGDGRGGIPPQELLAVGQGVVRSVRGFDRDELGPRTRAGEVIGARVAVVMTVVEVR
jgi:outer membrane protein assembly factor BamA